MDLVIDANILFSALIKDSTTADLLFEKSLRLFSPEFIVDEFLKYEGLLLNKTSREKQSFIQILHILQDVVIVIPKEEYSKFIKEAEEISPDEKDILYFALALKLRCGIWSNDKKLKEQNKIKVYSTGELRRFV